MYGIEARRWTDSTALWTISRLTCKVQDLVPDLPLAALLLDSGRYVPNVVMPYGRGGRVSGVAISSRSPSLEAMSYVD